MKHWLPIIRFLAARLAIYLAAVAVAYVLASVFATQSVVSSLAGMGLADHEVAQRGIGFIVDSVREDGSWPMR